MYFLPLFRMISLTNMETKDIEVEIKIPVSKQAFMKARKRLKKMADFVGASFEIDKYFNAPHRNFLKPKHPYEYLRLRVKNGKGVFAYKHVYFKKSGEKTHSDEYETEIDNPGRLEKILNVLNFKNFLIIDKQREKYIYKKQFEIVLDKVKGLGYFIEIEALKDFGGLDVTREKLLSFANQLGIDSSKRDNKGYVLLLMEKKGLIKNS